MAYDLEDFGNGWLGDDCSDVEGRQHVGLRGHVTWYVPRDRHPVSLCLVHGGGGQSSDFSTTPDGRPGWVQHFVSQGYAVYLLDRPGHGRSPRPHAEAADFTPDPAYEDLVAPFVYPETLGLWPGSESHSQWPAGNYEHAFMAGMRGMRRSLEAAQRDAEAVADELFALTGDTVLITHSAAGPCGWAMATHGRGRVKGIMAVEPLGGPGVETPWGTFGDSPTVVAPSGPDDPYQLPIGILTAPASGWMGQNTALVAQITALGGRPDHIRLAERGINGNGHMMMMERNNLEVADVILDWIKLHCQA